MSEEKFYENEKVVKVDLGGDNVILLHFENFDTDIDVDQLTYIDPTNIWAELITLPRLMNKIGLLRAEVDDFYEDAKQQLRIAEAEKSEYHRSRLAIRTGEKIKYPTVSEVENAVTVDPVFINLHKRLRRKKKEAAYLDSLYWAVKEKAGKLDKLSESMNLTPQDLDKMVVEGSINKILIKKTKKLIPDLKNKPLY